MSKQGCIASDKEYYTEIIQFQEKSYQYLAVIENYLKEQKIEDFIALMHKPDLREGCITVLSELGYAYVVAVISEEEKKVYGDYRFITNGNSLEEMINVLKSIEFCMWEVEFSCGQDAEECLKHCVCKYNLTSVAVKRIIEIAAIHKRDAYLVFSYMFLLIRKVEEAILLLQYAVEEYENDQELLGMMIDLCKSAGFVQLAESYKLRLK